ncbi:MAG: hypothetical protein MUD11_07030 [Rhodobacteraceae bacterium]|jgi:hypothetical protein|nr:hypothetical protein [Paracoccaceae bacterium]
MTTIITRLYADAATARGVVSALLAKGHDQDTIDVIGSDGVGTVADRMKAAAVNATSAAAYAAALTGGRTLVVVRAPFAPMGTARNAMRVMDRTPSVDVGVPGSEYRSESMSIVNAGSVMLDHPYFMSNPHRPMSHGHVFGAKLLSARKERRSAIAGGRLMSGMFWPMKHLSARKERTSAIKGTWLFSRLLADMPTVMRSR